ncbi:hypothetical protein RDABS01_028012 [Bienertia sinuspersici]
MLRGLNHFQMALVLKANDAKSEVFSANMNDEDVDKICERTCLKKGSWPFRYLGIPICNKKLSRDECELLIHRMTTTISSWQSRHISFAGRLQLVNAVLMSICTYWMQILILLIGVIKEINRIYRKFLWEGHLHGQKPGYVGWNQVCKPKSKSGLGIKDLNLWNNLVVCKIVWQIAEKKEYIWVKWVYTVYIKQQSWWDYQPSILASWIWRNICSAKKRLLKIDRTGWWPDSGKDFKIGKIYNKIKGKDEKMKWASLTWIKVSIGKHCFIWWLAVQERLMVTKRLFNYGISDDPWCELCGLQEETHEHLFFKCSIAHEIWKATFSCLQVTRRWSNMSEMIKWCKRRCRTSKFRSTVIIAACAAVIYSIWQARNQALWEHRRQNPDYIDAQVGYFVAKRCHVLCNKKFNVEDKTWLANIVV